MDKFKNFDDLFGDTPASEDENNLLFSESSDTDEIKKPVDDTKEKWKILVVDDEEDIHSVTRIALKGFTFRGRSIEFYDAFSAAEAEEILKKTPRHRPDPPGCGDGNHQCRSRPGKSDPRKTW